MYCNNTHKTHRSHFYHTHNTTKHHFINHSTKMAAATEQTLRLEVGVSREQGWCSVTVCCCMCVHVVRERSSVYCLFPPPFSPPLSPLASCYPSVFPCLLSCHYLLCCNAGSREHQEDEFDIDETHIKVRQWRITNIIIITIIFLILPLS